MNDTLAEALKDLQGEATLATNSFMEYEYVAVDDCLEFPSREKLPRPTPKSQPLYSAPKRQMRNQPYTRRAR